MLTLTRTLPKSKTFISRSLSSDKSTMKDTAQAIRDTFQKNFSELSETLNKAKKNFSNNKEKFQKTYKDKMSSDDFEKIKEFSSIAVGVGLLFGTSKIYEQNKDHLSEENVKKTLDTLLEPTLPKGFKEKSLQNARIDINYSLDILVHSQNTVSQARTIAASMSPALTVIPLLANPAFITTTTLAFSDLVNIGQIYRIKKMIDTHPDIFSASEKKEYDEIMQRIEHHIPKELAFDALKIFYRGQLVSVNRKLRENEKPQQVYKSDTLKELAGKRVIPLKNNLPIVKWILPTSYVISNLSSQDTRELSADIKNLDTFFKKTAFQCGRHTNEAENNNCTNTIKSLGNFLETLNVSDAVSDIHENNTDTASLTKSFQKLSVSDAVLENEPQSKKESDK